MSPELELLDQLLGGDAPLTQLRTLFENDERFVQSVLAMLTAVNFCYRLIKFAKAKRILFLADRNNLGNQTLNEFRQFVSPANGQPPG